jgi:hypothetical protein
MPATKLEEEDFAMLDSNFDSDEEETLSSQLMLGDRSTMEFGDLFCQNFYSMLT